MADEPNLFRDPLSFIPSPGAAPAAGSPSEFVGPRQEGAAGPAGSWYDATVKWLENANKVGDAFNSGFVRGIPVVGPWVEKGMQGAAALPSAVIPGMSVRDSYNKLQADTQTAREEHPVAAISGGLSGGVMSTVPIARAAPTLFGGNTLLPRLSMTAGVQPGQIAASTVLGGADATSRSLADKGYVDPNDVKWGAGIGAGAPVIGSILAPVGQLAAAGGRYVMSAPGLRSIRGQVAPMFETGGELAAPTAQQVAAGHRDALEQAADTGYRQLNNLYRYDPANVQDMVNLIKTDLYHGQTGARTVSPKSAALGATATHDILDRISSLPATPGALHTARKELNDLAGRTAGTNEAAAAQYAREVIDHFLEAPPPNAIVWHNPSSPANANAGQLLRDANANWQAMRQSQQVNKLLTDASIEAQRANPILPALVEGQIIGRNTTNLLKNPNKSEYMTPAQREVLQDANRYQSWGHGILDAAGRLSQTARLGFGTMLNIAGGVAAPLLGAVSYPTTGAAALAGVTGNLANTALTRQAMARADAAIRSQAPYAQQRIAETLAGPPGAASTNLAPPVNPMQYPSLNPFQHRNEITRQLMLQAEQQRQDMMGGGP